MLLFFFVGTGTEVKIKADDILCTLAFRYFHSVFLKKNAEQTVVKYAGCVVVTVPDAQIVTIQSTGFYIQNFNSCFVHLSFSLPY